MGIMGAVKTSSPIVQNPKSVDQLDAVETVWELGGDRRLSVCRDP
jgi:hypothetical protein